jgi:L-xylulokinase
MTEPHLLGIDCGLSSVKAVIFDRAGKSIGSGQVELSHQSPHPGHVERDMNALWRATAGATRQALEASHLPAASIVGIGVTGHGDGAFLLDRDGHPLGNGILSLDSRAIDVVQRWQASSVFGESLTLTGQHPHASAPSTLLTWIRRNEPERFDRIGCVFSCKDWLRYCLTDKIATDPTEASVSFTNVNTQTYDADVLALFGLDDLYPALPPIGPAMDVAGRVSSEAATRTGLSEGTPVVTGLHDVAAAAVGMGSIEPGMAAIVAGTYSINEMLVPVPDTGAGWFCRNSFRPNQWNVMAISPASSANSDWILHQFCKEAVTAAETSGGHPFDYLQDEISAAFDRDSHLIYHPFLFGSPYGGVSSASLIGLNGWHDRGDVLKAVFEGIVFNHKHHIDALRSINDVSAARLTGGGSQNPLFCQLFADALGLDIGVVDHDQAGALGVALMAGVGVGLYPSIEAASAETTRIQSHYRPNESRQQDLAKAYERYRQSIERISPLWPDIREP